MIIVLATFPDPDGGDQEVFGPFADKIAAADWINAVDEIFNGHDGLRPATWHIMALSEPFTL